MSLYINKDFVVLDTVIKAYAERVVESYNSGDAVVCIVMADAADIADGVLHKATSHLVGEGVPLDGLYVVVRLTFAEGDPAVIVVELKDYDKARQEGHEYTPIYDTFDTINILAPDGDEEDGEDFGEDEEEYDSTITTTATVEINANNDQPVSAILDLLVKRSADVMGIDSDTVYISGCHTEYWEADNAIQLSAEIAIPSTVTPAQLKKLSTTNQSVDLQDAPTNDDLGNAVEVDLTRLEKE